VQRIGVMQAAGGGRPGGDSARPPGARRAGGM
jgi:hypothetical protein